ncbi:hypothetical protein R3P38DRAFT_2785203 [Favolaschia claudopus]|uniref:Uncharacterized protein n=1 Tax=Favolaschia claudopus TaxID=2862362 RepID=A0AAW0AVI5_9AGAR
MKYSRRTYKIRSKHPHPPLGQLPGEGLLCAPAQVQDVSQNANLIIGVGILGSQRRSTSLRVRASREANGGYTRTQQRKDALEAMKTRHEQALVDDRTRLTATLDDLRAQHVKGLDTLRKDRDLLAGLQSHKAAAERVLMNKLQARRLLAQRWRSSFQLSFGKSLIKRVRRSPSPGSRHEAEMAQLREELEETREAHLSANAEREYFETETARPLATDRVEWIRVRGQHRKNTMRRAKPRFRRGAQYELDRVAVSASCMTREADYPPKTFLADFPPALQSGGGSERASEGE